MSEYKFPHGFLWGTATSAHQTEGNNKNSDWWRWEKTKYPSSKISTTEYQYPLEESGIACDSYNRYEEDFDLSVKLNNNAIRISIEWARIEPEEGKFNEKEIEHYKKVLIAARNRKLKTFVTLHHFTNPLWFAEKKSWLNIKAPYYFSRYANRCALEFGKLVDVFFTINEPQVYISQSFFKGQWYPCKKNYIYSLLGQINMMRAHIWAYKAIKSVNSKYTVGLVKHIVWYNPVSKIWDRIFCKILDFLVCDFFLIPISRHLDVLGVNFYFSTFINNLKTSNLDDRNSDLNWWIWPKGLEKVLLWLKKYNRPIYVTENGLADAKDKNRKDFIRDMLISVNKAIKEGSDVKGYFHWSLIDNYEWHHGFWPRFGLVEIDRVNSLERKPRPSFYYYSDICKENKVVD
jgi:beta-glucosidase